MKKFMTDVKEDPHLHLVRAHFIGRRYFIVWSSLGYEVLGLRQVKITRNINTFKRKMLRDQIANTPQKTVVYVGNIGIL